MFGLLKNFSVLCLIILNALTSLVNCLEVVYAVNAGGKSHRDIHGILYDQDPLFNKTGTDSDYGKQWMIKRIPEQDHILYQTERYHHSTFGYDIPMKQDGNYVIVLKFCEVYFNSPNMKVFDVMLNQEHHVVSELDIFAKVGRAVAHDEYIQFSVEGGKLMYNNEVSNIKDGRVKIEFIKVLLYLYKIFNRSNKSWFLLQGYKDNPKINAIAVIKGDLKG